MKGAPYYAPPVIICSRNFFSLREAGLKGGGGLIGRNAAKIAHFMIFKRATSHAALFRLMRGSKFDR